MREPTDPISLRTISLKLKEIVSKLHKDCRDLAITITFDHDNSEIESAVDKLERQFSEAFRNLLRFAPSNERLDCELPSLSTVENEAFRRYKTLASVYLCCLDRGYTRLLPIIEEEIASLVITENVYYHTIVDTIKSHRSDID